MSLPNLKRKGAPGFTLVEMAIVLVIIGIILAGVMKGRDIVRGAQVKQFSQQFAQKWGTVAQTYYDKTGRVLNDYEVNGASTATATPDGKMDGKLAANIVAVVASLNRVGITPCTLIKSKISEDITTSVIASGTTPVAASCDTSSSGVNLQMTQVEGEYAGMHNVQADLQSVRISTASGVVTDRNAVLLYGVPTDVCIGLDTAIDGVENGQEGSVVNLLTVADATARSAGLTKQTTVSTTAISALAWPNANAANVQVAAILLDF